MHTVFLVTRKAKNQGRSGKAYLALVLSDKTGDVDGRIFDGIEQFEPTFGTGDYVLVQGEVISFHGKPQILRRRRTARNAGRRSCARPPGGCEIRTSKRSSALSSMSQR